MIGRGCKTRRKTRRKTRPQIGGGYRSTPAPARARTRRKPPRLALGVLVSSQEARSARPRTGHGAAPIQSPTAKAASAACTVVLDPGTPPSQARSAWQSERCPLSDRRVMVQTTRASPNPGFEPATHPGSNKIRLKENRRHRQQSARLQTSHDSDHQHGQTDPTGLSRKTMMKVPSENNARARPASIPDASTGHHSQRRAKTCCRLMRTKRLKFLNAL